MKKFYILLVGLLLTTQAFALNKTQRNVLLGVGAGAILVYALESHDRHTYKQQPVKRVAKNSHFKDKKIHRKMHKKMHRKHARKHARQHARKHYRNHHRNDYYVINDYGRYCFR